MLVTFTVSLVLMHFNLFVYFPQLKDSGSHLMDSLKDSDMIIVGVLPPGLVV